MLTEQVPREGESIFRAPAKPDYRIDPETGCWIWQKGLLRGYPHAGSPHRRPHRTYYELAHGPVPEGHHVHHKCEDTRCVNPDHLEALPFREHLALHHLHSRGRTPDDVREIRRLGRSNVPAVDVAASFGISTASVYYYWRGEMWPEILGESGPVAREPWSCVSCGGPIHGATRRSKRYCSLACRDYEKNERARERRQTVAHYTPAITEEMVTAAGRSLGYRGYALDSASVRDQIRGALAIAVEMPRRPER